MAKTSNKTSKKELKQRTKMENVLLAILILILLFLLLGFGLKWLRWDFGGNGDDLGSAFYPTTKKLSDIVPGSGSGSGSGGSGGSSSGSHNGSNSGGGSGGSGGGGNTTPSGSHSALISFAAGIDRGDTKEQTSGEAQGIDQNCAILVNSTTAGKQEVCTYREGDKLVTVTFLDDHVVTASRQGF